MKPLLTDRCPLRIRCKDKEDFRINKENSYYFPKYMDYRTKQGCFMYVIPIFLNKPL